MLSSLKRKMIEKANGGMCPLGIPAIKDRVAQMACKLVVEPVFEADFNGSSYGFRPKRSAHGAMKEIKEHLKNGDHMVFDADLSKYFDTVPHNKLRIALQERIADTGVLHLINLWLKSPLVEEDGRYTGGKKNKKGTPQGGVISPLLANIYMNLLDRIVNKPDGYFGSKGIKMIRYADDFILMAKQINHEVLHRIYGLLDRMGLTINKEKSKLVKARENPFDFLGFTIRYDRSIYNNQGRFRNIKPGANSEKKVRQSINAKLKKTGHYPATAVSMGLNSVIRGRMNYYRIEKVSYTQVSFRKLNDYLRYRIARYYNRKSQMKSSLYDRQAYGLLTSYYGLIRPYNTSGRRPVKAL